MGAVVLSGGLGYRKGFEAGIAKQNLPALPRRPVVSALATPVDAQPEVTPCRACNVGARTERSARDVCNTRSGRRSASAASRRTCDSREQPAACLVLLEDLDRAIPTGQLLEERRAASIMASCQLGAGGAVANARAFIAKHAGSAYFTRVIEICGLESERNPAPSGHTFQDRGG